MIDKIFHNVHKHWYFRILFVPTLLLSATLFAIKSAQFGALLLFIVWFVSIAAGMGSMPEKYDFDPSNVFFLWSEIIIVLYMVLLMHRSIRVIFGRPFYLTQKDQRIYFRYEQLKTYTTGYMLVLIPISMILPQAHS